MAVDAGLTARLDAVIDGALGARIVGCVVLVAHDGETIYARAAGDADREAGRPVRRDTIFRYASLTKPIVSAAALGLVEEGLIHLGDPVTRYLPEFRPRLADGSQPEITLSHLLTHTSGLTYDFMEPPESAYHGRGISNGFDVAGVQMEENLRRIADWPLAFEPGKGWNYSVSTDVLGAVLAVASGATLPQVVRRKVTGPLGMNDTDFAVVDRERLAAPYADATPQPVRMAASHVVPFAPSPLRFAPDRILDPAASFPSGGAGMAGNADDYLTFLEAIRTGGGSILAPHSARLMLENAIGDIAVTATGPGFGFSLGGAILRDPEVAATPQPAGTWSWGGVYGGSWFVDPVNRLTVVAVTNTAIEGMVGAFTIGVRNAVYGLDA